MSWKTFHNRGETLRVVVSTANERRDGVLPTDVPGVIENFHDDLDLVGALLLKWHARLSGNIERSLTREPMDLESAVAGAWRTTAEQMPGVRLVIDRCFDSPGSPEMEAAMGRAREHELLRLATAAGLASAAGPSAAAAGRRVEDLARAGLANPVVVPPAKAVLTAGPVATTVTTTAVTTTGTTPGTTGTTPTGGPSFVDRIKAVLAA